MRGLLSLQMATPSPERICVVPCPNQAATPESVSSFSSRQYAFLAHTCVEAVWLTASNLFHPVRPCLNCPVRNLSHQNSRQGSVKPQSKFKPREESRVGVRRGQGVVGIADVVVLSREASKGLDEPWQGSFDCPTTAPTRGPANPTLLAYREKNRDRVRRERQREAKQEVQREGKRGRRGCFFTLSQRNELAEHYSGMIQRVVRLSRESQITSKHIVNRAVARGLPTYIERDDLEQDLNLALLEALDRYQPVPNAKLDTYVWACLVSGRATDQLGGCIAKAVNKYKRQQSTERRKCETCDGEAADEAGEKCDECGGAGYRYVLPKPLYRGPGIARPAEVPDGGWTEGRRTDPAETDDFEGCKKVAEPIAGWINRKDRRMDIRRALAGLSAVERQVIGLHWLGHTQLQIADEVGHAQSWVCEVLKSGLAHMRQFLTRTVRREADDSIAGGRRFFAIQVRIAHGQDCDEAGIFRPHPRARPSDAPLYPTVRVEQLAGAIEAALLGGDPAGYRSARITLAREKLGRRLRDARLVGSLSTIAFI